MKLLLVLGLFSRISRFIIRTRRSASLPLIFAALVGTRSCASFAEVFYAKDEALTLAFPQGSIVAQQSFIITPEQKRKVEESAKVRLESDLYTFFEGRLNNEIVGYAAIDSRIMRTMHATYMVVLSPKGEIKKVVILAFNEPREYMPINGWFKHFEDPMPIDEIAPDRGIPPIAGSTLSVESISTGVRAVNALFNTLILNK